MKLFTGNQSSIPLSKKVGSKIADVMNINLARTLEDGPQTEGAMICTMIMPHLLLATSKSETDASITKKLSRRLDLWIRCKFDSFFVEAKALQERLYKLYRKREMDEFNALDKQIESGTISNALRCLSDEAKSDALSTSDSVTTNGKNFTVLDLQKKHPCNQKADLKYVVTDLKYGDLQFHPSIFGKINGAEIK